MFSTALLTTARGNDGPRARELRFDEQRSLRNQAASYVCDRGASGGMLLTQHNFRIHATFPHRQVLTPPRALYPLHPAITHMRHRMMASTSFSRSPS